MTSSYYISTRFPLVCFHPIGSGYSPTLLGVVRLWRPGGSILTRVTRASHIIWAKCRVLVSTHICVLTWLVLCIPGLCVLTGQGRGGQLEGGGGAQRQLVPAQTGGQRQRDLRGRQQRGHEGLRGGPGAKLVTGLGLRTRNSWQLIFCLTREWARGGAEQLPWQTRDLWRRWDYCIRRRYHGWQQLVWKQILSITRLQKNCLYVPLDEDMIWSFLSVTDINLGIGLTLEANIWSRGIMVEDIIWSRVIGGESSDTSLGDISVGSGSGPGYPGAGSPENWSAAAGAEAGLWVRSWPPGPTGREMLPWEIVTSWAVELMQGWGEWEDRDVMETPEEAEPGNLRPVPEAETLNPEAETLNPEAVWGWEPRLEVKITLVLLLAVFREAGDSTSSRPRSESSVIESRGTSKKLLHIAKAEISWNYLCREIELLR